MKLSAELSNINPVLVTLQSIEKGMTNVFKNALKEEADDLRDLAKQELEEASLIRTGKKYWTGLLQSSIEANTQEDRTGYIELTVGVNEEKYGVGDYAVPVEKGHRISNPWSVTGLPTGAFWEGYHYMENAYVGWSPGVTQRIAEVLTQVIETPWGYRNIATGQWVKAQTK